MQVSTSFLPMLFSIINNIYKEKVPTVKLNDFGQNNTI